MTKKERPRCPPGQDITVQAGRDLTVKGSGIASEQGKVELTGENVSISGETEYHERLHEEHREKVGFLSSTKTDIYDRQTLEAVAGSSISGDSVDITATGKDITISGSSVVADNDVTLKAQENVNITSQEETSSSDYRKKVKKSGLLSGGGLGFTIGKEKQKDTYANQNIEQAGSTIGSIDGNVTIEAGKDVTAQASDVIAGQDISLTGETVTIESKDNTYNAQEKHEYKKSGLTVAVGGNTVKALEKVVAPLERATQVQDERLAALYGYKAYDTLKDTKKDLEGIKDPKNNLSIEISIGTQKSESQAKSGSTLARESNITAQGDVNIHATQEDISIHGSNVSGENVTLKAQENIKITASENTNITNQTSKSSQGSIGVSISVEGISGINAGYNKAKGEIKENSTVYNPSNVTAKDTLTLESGKDTNIIGSKVSGDTVKAEVGENLNIESLQAQESYDEKNSSSGLSISVDISKNVQGKTVTGQPGIQGSANKGKIQSDYESVTDQAGIYAGEGGFDINVGKNTDLKGAVISSEATTDKNKISTDTLTYSDIKNKAEYSASSSGYGLQNGSVIPVPEIPVNGDADSTTQSAISPGTIEVRSGDTDVSRINRNTDQALNALGKIFDKEAVKEKQELVNLFSQETNKIIGDFAERMREKASTPEEKAKWAEGGEYKALLHAVAAGITSSLSGNGFASGAVADGLSQLAQKELSKITDKNLRLIASAAIGAAAAEVVGGNAQVGAGAAYNGVKYNDYNHRTHREGEIVHTKDGFFMVINGVDTAIAPPPEGVYFWEQDANNPDYGWDYQKGNGISSVDTYFPGVVQYQTILFEINGKAIGIAITDDTDAQKKELILAKAREWASGVIALGSGYSGGSLAGGIGTGVRAAEEAAAVATAAKALNGIKVSSKIERSADEVNNWWKIEKGYDKPPYKPGTVVQEVELKETTTFVRVYDDENSFQKGGWVMKKEDIAGLTPEQIRDKFALPEVPKYITDVTIPAGTKVRVGEANEVAGWGKGGGTQIDLVGQRGIGEEFSNPRPLE